MAKNSVSVAEIFKGIIIAAAIVFACVIAIYPVHTPPEISESVSNGEFNIERALKDLEVITETHRVPGTSGYEKARNYIASELEALGFEVEITNTISVRSQSGNANTARARSVVARLRGYDSTGAVLLGGHLDTVHTTTGASDCGAGAIGVLETARAISQGEKLRNDIIFIMEDGEETSRSGSNSFAQEHRWAEDVRVAVNLEAMGTGGSSLLYVTGPENGWLIDQALEVMPDPVAYSFVNDLVWLTGTGGSDLDQFLDIAEVGLGLIYLNNVPAYHTMEDSIENLEPAAFNHQGNTMLALARHYADLPLDQNLTRDDAVYFNLFSRFIVNYPKWVGIIVAAISAAGVLLLLFFGFRHKRLGWKGVLTGAAVFLPFTIGAVGITGGLWYLLRLLDPRLQVFLIGISYDRPLYTLAFALLAAGIITAGYILLKKRKVEELSAGASLWFALIALLTAFSLPGTSYIFSFTLLFALPGIFSVVYSDKFGHWGRTALLAASIFMALLMYVPAINFVGIFSGRAELIMGLPLIAMLPAFFTSFLAALLLPVLQSAGFGRRWIPAAVLSGAAVIILIGIAVTADFTQDRPKPNLAAYVLDVDEDRSYWVTGSVNVGGRRASLQDEWTQQFFPDGADEGFYSPWGGFMPDTFPAYTGAAPEINLKLPIAEVLDDTIDDLGRRQMRIKLLSQRNAETMVAIVRTEGNIVSARIAGKNIEGPEPETPLSHLNLGLYGSTAGEGLVLEIVLNESAGLEIFLEDHSYKLPRIEGFEIQQRPEWMMPSPTFISDSTIVRHTIRIK